MYAHQDEWDVEEICYDDSHIDKVIEELRKNFDGYFEQFIETEAGAGVSEQAFKDLQKAFGTKTVTKRSAKNGSKAFKSIISNAYIKFEKDRQKYLDIFDTDMLEEYQDDPSYFKSQVLKINCPIIHATLFNRHAKELDKYRAQFSTAAPQELLSVVTVLCEFSSDYMKNVYDADTYEKIESIDEMGLSPLDQDEGYTVYGVIGGGIKSHMLFKVHPSVFPNRSRSALWALWFLTGKKSFGCKMDSEFLMIDVDKSIAQQNYFYPYDLFAFYALELSGLLSEKAESMEAYIDPEYRYVIVDAFLNFVAKQHQEETDLLKSQIRDGGMGYV